VVEKGLACLTVVCRQTAFPGRSRLRKQADDSVAASTLVLRDTDAALEDYTAVRCPLVTPSVIFLMRRLMCLSRMARPELEESLQSARCVDESEALPPKERLGSRVGGDLG